MYKNVYSSCIHQNSKPNTTCVNHQENETIKYGTGRQQNNM